jgi:hypothetical protein
MIHLRRLLVVAVVCGLAAAWLLSLKTIALTPATG